VALHSFTLTQGGEQARQCILRIHLQSYSAGFFRKRCRAGQLRLCLRIIFIGQHSLASPATRDRLEFAQAVWLCDREQFVSIGAAASDIAVRECNLCQPAKAADHHVAFGSAARLFERGLQWRHDIFLPEP
jgi:hypothetical protein